MWKAKAVSTPALRCRGMWSLEENFKGDPQMKSSRAERLAAPLEEPVLGSRLGILTLGQISVGCWRLLEISPQVLLSLS